MPHIHDLKVENDVLKGQVNDLKSENGALKTNLDNLRKDVKTMQNSLSQMSTMLTERSHFESGKLECGDSNSWTGRESGQTSICLFVYLSDEQSSSHSKHVHSCDDLISRVFFRVWMLIVSVSSWF